MARNENGSLNMGRTYECVAEETHDEDEVTMEQAVALMRALATLKRVLRNDKPRGVLPSKITARPKTKGLMPRHEYWID